MHDEQKSSRDQRGVVTDTAAVQAAAEATLSEALSSEEPPIVQVERIRSAAEHYKADMTKVVEVLRLQAAEDMATARTRAEKEIEASRAKAAAEAQQASLLQASAVERIRGRYRIAVGVIGIVGAGVGALLGSRASRPKSPDHSLGSVQRRANDVADEATRLRIAAEEGDNASVPDLATETQRRAAALASFVKQLSTPKVK